MFPWYLIFLKRSLIFPVLLFPSISLHWCLRKAFLSLLSVLWNSSFKWAYLFFSPLPFAYLLFSEICKGSSDNHFASFCFFFLGMVLITACCAVSGTSDTLGSLPLGLWVGRVLCAAVALPWCLLHPLFCGWAGWALGCYVRAFGWKVLFSTVGVRVVFPHIPHCGRVSCCVETSLHSLLPP